MTNHYKLSYKELLNLTEISPRQQCSAFKGLFSWPDIKVRQFGPKARHFVRTAALTEDRRLRCEHDAQNPEFRHSDSDSFLKHAWP